MMLTIFLVVLSFSVIDANGFGGGGGGGFDGFEISPDLLPIKGPVELIMPGGGGLSCAGLKERCDNAECCKDSSLPLGCATTPTGKYCLYEKRIIFSVLATAIREPPPPLPIKCKNKQQDCFQHKDCCSSVCITLAKGLQGFCGDGKH